MEETEREKEGKEGAKKRSDQAPGRNQSVNLFGNKGPNATYKSQNTIYNSYSPRQCM